MKGERQTEIAQEVFIDRFANNNWGCLLSYFIAFCLLFFAFTCFYLFFCRLPLLCLWFFARATAVKQELGIQINQERREGEGEAFVLEWGSKWIRKGRVFVCMVFIFLQFVFLI